MSIFTASSGSSSVLVVPSCPLSHVYVKSRWRRRHRQPLLVISHIIFVFAMQRVVSSRSQQQHLACWTAYGVPKPIESCLQISDLFLLCCNLVAKPLILGTEGYVLLTKSRVMLILIAESIESSDPSAPSDTLVQLKCARNESATNPSNCYLTSYAENNSNIPAEYPTRVSHTSTAASPACSGVEFTGSADPVFSSE